MNNFRYRKLEGTNIVKLGDWLTVTKDEFDPNDSLDKNKLEDAVAKNLGAAPSITAAYGLIGREAESLKRYTAWRIEVPGAEVTTSEPEDNERKIDLNL